MQKATLFTSLTLWLWLLSIPAATVGLPVYEVYCYCLKQTSFAFFSATDPCSAHSEKQKASACCAKEKPVCHQTESREKTSCCLSKKHKDHDGSCTKTTLKLHQLKAKYLVDGPLSLDYAWSMPVALAHNLFRASVWITQDRPLPAPPQPPPPLSGRDICVRHACFLC